MAQDKKAEASPHTFTGNLNLVSEYRYRGISQTNNKPAVQGGFDYAHASGVYVGTWASNVSWLSDGGGGTVSNSLEWDIYGGYKGAVGDFGYDVGPAVLLLPRQLPGRLQQPEHARSLRRRFVQDVDPEVLALADRPVRLHRQQGLGLHRPDRHLRHRQRLHAGRRTTATRASPSTSGRSRSDCSYNDWKVGVTKDLVGLTWGLSYIDTDSKGGVGQCYRNAFNRDLGKGNVVLSVSKTF
jgi:hypothetical protein